MVPIQLQRAEDLDPFDDSKHVAKVAAFAVLALAAYHGYAALLLLSILMRGKTTYWNLFRVVNCCDIPSHEVIAGTAATIVQLTIVALVGNSLARGLRRFQRRAWWGSVMLCSLIILVHWAMTGSLVDSAKGDHYVFMLCTCIPLGLLLSCRALYLKPDSTSGE